MGAKYLNPLFILQQAESTVGEDQDSANSGGILAAKVETTSLPTALLMALPLHDQTAASGLRLQAIVCHRAA